MRQAYTRATPNNKALLLQSVADARNTAVTVRRARLEAQIARLLTQGLADDSERLAEVGRLGARLVLQCAVEDEVTAFLGRARASWAATWCCTRPALSVR